MASIPKAALYYSPISVWSAVARLAIIEKGYGDDEIDLRIVDIEKGENYDPTFLRLNPTASVPALLVPYENSLSDDVASHRYKSLTDVKAIVAFLDTSRSARSATHSTSSAPAPMLTPATVAASTTCRTVIAEILHGAGADPETLQYFNARDEGALRELAATLGPSLVQRQATLTGYLQQATMARVGDGEGAGVGAGASEGNGGGNGVSGIREGEGGLRVSEKVKKLWVDRLDAIGLILAVLGEAGKAESALDEQARGKRASFFKSAQQAWEVNAVEVLVRLDSEMEGPFVLGDQFSIADLHLAGWMAHVVKLAGGSGAEDGKSVVKRLEAYIGGGFRFAQTFATEQARREGSAAEKQAKLGAFWDAVRQRTSWKKVYADGIF